MKSIKIFFTSLFLIFFFVGCEETTIFVTKPIAVDDNVTLDEDGSTNIDITSNDTAVGSRTIDVSTIFPFSPSHGNIELNISTGIIKYTPVSNFHGSDSFTYTVRDSGGFLSNVATVGITVTSINDAPSDILIPLINFGTFSDFSIGNSDRSNSEYAVLKDLDNDGDLDIYVANSIVTINNKLWRNDGNISSFVDASIFGDSSNSLGIAWGDFNSDGLIDLYLANYDTFGTQNTLFINDGNLSFTGTTITADSDSSQKAVAGDLNGDGFLDIYVVNGFGNIEARNRNKVLINDGNASFINQDISEDNASSLDAVMGDFNGDGFLDIYVVNKGQNFLWFNDGNASFTARNIIGDDGLFSTSASLGDIDNDGDLDIYVTNSTGTNRLWLNFGNGLFQSYTISSASTFSFGSFMGDIDNDGDLDIYVANEGTQNTILINDGNLSFSELNITSDVGDSKSAVMEDIDNDADLDIYVSNSSDQNNRLWINEARGQVIESNSSIGTVVGAFITKDFDVNDTHTYTLVGGLGSEDNLRFSLNGANLELAFVPDFNTPIDLGDTVGDNTYSIRVQSDDGNGGIFQKIFIITVIP